MRTVLIASEPVFRCGFKTVIEGAPDLRLVGDAPDARSGFQLIDREKPAVAVIALSLSGMNGITAAREVKGRSPATRVLLIGPGPREREIVEGLSAGADGFALTTDPVDVLLAAIRAVGSGQRHLPVGLRGLNDSSRIAVLATDLLAMLSRREREVLDLVIRGWRSSNIARELCVSIKTVETHRAHINRKLRCSSSSDLVRFAADNGLLPGAPSAGAGASRTFVLVVETDSPMKGELMRELAADGYERADASNVTSAMAQVEAIPPVRPLAIEAHGSASAPDVYDLLIRRGGTGPMPLVLALDGADDHRPTLRAIACLPQAEAGLGFLTALERAGANHALRLVDHATVA